MIKIRAITKDDFSFVRSWSEDEQFCLANGWELNRSEDELEAWWTTCVDQEREDFIRLGIDYENKLIGYVDLADIKENRAEIGIAIGARNLWGKGIGTTAIEKLITHAEENLEITMLKAETHETNLSSKKLLEKLGFEEISRIGFEEYLGAEIRLIQYQMDLESAD